MLSIVLGRGAASAALLVISLGLSLVVGSVLGLKQGLLVLELLHVGIQIGLHIRIESGLLLLLENLVEKSLLLSGLKVVVGEAGTKGELGLKLGILSRLSFSLVGLLLQD